MKFLLEKKAALIKAMKSLVELVEKENRIFTEDETKSLAASKAEIAQITSQIELLQGFPVEESKSTTEKSPVAAAAQVHAIGNSIPALSGKKDFESLEEFMATVAFNPGDSRLEYKSQQNMGTGSAGGFMVPKIFIPTILSNDPAASLVRPRAKVIAAGTPADAEISMPALDQETGTTGARVYGGVTVAKVSEGGLKPATEGKLRLISLQPQEIAATLPMTDKLKRNWTAAGDWAASLLRSAILGYEDAEFLAGNGIGGPQGVINSGATYKVARAVSNQVSLADIQKMYARFKGNSANAIWAVSAALFEQMLALVGNGSGATNIIPVTANPVTGVTSIYGIPLVKHERLPGLGLKGDLGLYDFSSYLIKDGSGPLVEAGYTSGQWERNASSIKVTFNVDGKAWLTQPLKGEDNYECSPFVVLDVPAGS